MTGLILACLWAISANVIAMVHDAPKYRLHWFLARVLVLCLPIVLWRVGIDHGLGWMMAALCVAIFQLRLLLRYLGRHFVKWVRQKA